MATPAKSIRGLTQARAAFRALPDIVRTRSLDATSVTVQQIANGARARVQASPSIHTRALYNYIGWSLSRRSGRGRAGIASGTISVPQGTGARLDRPSRRGHFVEFGTVAMPAEPFMIPAAEAQAQPYLARMKTAGKDVERDMAAIGLRNL